MINVHSLMEFISLPYRFFRSIGENYYNGPLKIGTNYKIFQRIFINDQGDYYSTDSSPVAATAQKHKSSDGGNTGAIAGVVGKIPSTEIHIPICVICTLFEDIKPHLYTFNHI
ncbi:uncharacterized protein LOC124450298 [Xenia sp. Carnegie-2017]|uniref:uncharacterized protein LOC124450298 n=1 Tax=Xenia sp. Carnegie-2017 TaxID=2897299 RepID=UPI001F044093|nr:uncharacterized protein LOC124450298 [Xenia sp. Carnegie-2017]